MFVQGHNMQRNNQVSAAVKSGFAKWTWCRTDLVTAKLNLMTQLHVHEVRWRSDTQQSSQVINKWTSRRASYWVKEAGSDRKWWKGHLLKYRASIFSYVIFHFTWGANTLLFTVLHSSDSSGLRKHKLIFLNMKICCSLTCMLYINASNNKHTHRVIVLHCTGGRCAVSGLTFHTLIIYFFIFQIWLVSELF